MLFVLSTLAYVVCATGSGGPRQVNYKSAMDEYSLDTLDYNKVFDNYQLTGTAVMLANTVKVLPQIKTKTGGQLFTSKVSLTHTLYFLLIASFDESMACDF